ncbi:hypothetical protein BJ742DRAFT_772286 [Cladochytrium replicatum]|nr:hypothetical protein BJ742DRAFT_772286 [Cladochytrium replicatum]
MPQGFGMGQSYMPPLSNGTHHQQEEITTIFVVGFPEDMGEREFQNMFTFCPGFEAATLKIPSGDVDDSNARKQIIGFAKFRTRLEALEARDILSGRKVDAEKGHVLKAEMAKKNLHTKRGLSNDAGGLSNGGGAPFGVSVQRRVAAKDLPYDSYYIDSPPPMPRGLLNGNDMTYETFERYMDRTDQPLPRSSPASFNDVNPFDSSAKSYPELMVLSGPAGGFGDLLDMRSRLGANMSAPAARSTLLESLVLPSRLEGTRGTQALAELLEGPSSQSSSHHLLLPRSTGNSAPPAAPALERGFSSALYSSESLLQNRMQDLRINTSVNVINGSVSAPGMGGPSQSGNMLGVHANLGVPQPAANPAITPGGSPTTPHSAYPTPFRTGADQNPPCNTLYVGNLPPNTSEQELWNLFSRCVGFKRLLFRTRPNGPMCFVEFDDVQCATVALHELSGQPLSNSTKGGIRLSFSKNPLGVRQQQPQQPSTTMSPQTAPLVPGQTMTPKLSITVPPGTMAQHAIQGLSTPGSAPGSANMFSPQIAMNLDKEGRLIHGH